MRAGAGQTLEIGKRVKREIHFPGRAAVFVAADTFEKIRGQLAGVEKSFESEMRIDTGRDYVGGNFFAALQGDATAAAVFDEDFRDARLCANFHAGLAGSVGDSVGNRSRAAAAEAPRAKRAVDFAHVVMQENVSSPRRANTKKGADDAGSRHGGLEDVGLKPLVEKISGAHRHELNE